MKSAKSQGDIIKNVTPGNPNAMIRQQQGNLIGVDLDRPGVNVLRGDMDEMRKMTRALDEIRVQLGSLALTSAPPDGFTIDKLTINVNEIHRGRPYDHSKSMKQTRMTSITIRSDSSKCQMIC